MLCVKLVATVYKGDDNKLINYNLKINIYL
jgi:hypothetical protein